MEYSSRAMLLHVDIDDVFDASVKGPRCGLARCAIQPLRTLRRSRVIC